MYFSLLKFTTMKKIFTFLAVMGISAASFAQWQNGADRQPQFDNRNNSYNTYNSSTLILNAFTERRYTVLVDNMQYQLNGNYDRRGYNNTINVGAMAPGKHTITVFENRQSFWGRQKQKDVYCGTLFFKPGVETSLNINNYGQVTIAERQLYQNNGYGYGRDRDHDRDNRRRDDDRRGDDDHHGWNH